MKKKNIHRYLYISIVIAILTIALKYCAYYITDSVGFLSDALESVVNLLAAIFALIMLRLSEKPADKDHTFGHTKAEYFSSAVEGALILFAALTIIVSAIRRLMYPVTLDNINIGILFSLGASLLNLIVGLLLVRRGKEHRSIALEADGRHLLTDVITSVGVIVAMVIVNFTGWTVIDPIIAIAVAINIIFTGYRLISISANGLLDAAIPEEEYDKIVNYLDSLKEQNVTYHSLQTRLAGRRKFVSLHVLVPGDWSVKKGHDLTDKIEITIRCMFDDPFTVSTHLEPAEDPLSFADEGIDRNVNCGGC